MVRIIQLIFILSLVCYACNTSNKEHVITEDGIVRFCPPPDNCNDYMIEIKSELYKPDHLADKFKKDGLYISVAYIMTAEKHNCGFGGYKPVINIKQINLKK